MDSQIDSENEGLYQLRPVARYDDANRTDGDNAVSDAAQGRTSNGANNHANSGANGDVDSSAGGTAAASAARLTRGVGARHLGCVLPAVTAALGCPVPTAIHADPDRLRRELGLPQARAAIVVLVDGLGYWNLTLRKGHAPYLRHLLGDSTGSAPISTCFPATTVAAMGTFGTGTCPGLTGMTGYSQLNPSNGKICQLIAFRDAIAPAQLQTQPTIFSALAGEGVRVTSIGLPKFATSALTEAAFHGADYHGLRHMDERAEAAADACREPGLTYLYFNECDKAGHNCGWESDTWIAAFEKIDGCLGLLRRSVPRGTLIVVVADHGMVQTDPDQRIDIAAVPELSRGVRLVGGEPRAPMLYVEPGTDPRDVADRWRDYLGDRAWVGTRREAIDAGFYGIVRPDVEPMIGDVVAAANGRVTLVDSRCQADKATRLPSVHGSATIMESDIPFLVDLVE
ncbi:MAG: alkaline phosphatase family protein [Bifidobacteriaceae bacterium]|nr:alkaline phosphatase family protein [Bifidobacteriaceae bacterium]